MAAQVVGNDVGLRPPPAPGAGKPLLHGIPERLGGVAHAADDEQSVRDTDAVGLADHVPYVRRAGAKEDQHIDRSVASLSETPQRQLRQVPQCQELLDEVCGRGHCTQIIAHTRPSCPAPSM